MSPLRIQILALAAKGRSVEEISKTARTTKEFVREVLSGEPPKPRRYAPPQGDPTELEILAATAKLREGWSEKRLRVRAGLSEVPVVILTASLHWESEQVYR